MTPDSSEMPIPDANGPENFVFHPSEDADSVITFDPETERLALGSRDFALTVTHVQRGPDLFLTIEARDKAGQFVTHQTLLLKDTRPEDLGDALS